MLFILWERKQHLNIFTVKALTWHYTPLDAIKHQFLLCFYLMDYIMSAGFSHHFQLLHPQLFATLQGHALLLHILQSVVPYSGAQTDHYITPGEKKRVREGERQMAESCHRDDEDTDFRRFCRLLVRMLR